MPRTRSERKRRAVLQAAEEVFLRDGYAGASMDAVAEASGVSKQTVYGHFGSKEGLFTELVDAMTAVPGDRLLDGAEVGGPDGPADAEALRAHLETYAERQLAEVLTPRLLRLRRLAIGEAERFPELAAAVYAGGPRRAVTALERAIGTYADRGLLVVDDRALAAAHLNWLVLGEPLHACMFLGDGAIPDAATRAHHARAGVAVFLAAYGVR